MTLGTLFGTGNALTVGLQVVAELEAAAALLNGKPGDKEELAAIHVRVHGRRIKLCATAELEE